MGKIEVFCQNPSLILFVLYKQPQIGTLRTYSKHKKSWVILLYKNIALTSVISMLRLLKSHKYFKALKALYTHSNWLAQNIHSQFRLGKYRTRAIKYRSLIVFFLHFLLQCGCYSRRLLLHIFKNLILTLRDQQS